MNRLELSMSQATMNQRRHGALEVEEFLQVAERFQHFRYRRRNESRCDQVAAGWANPVLRSRNWPGWRLLPRVSRNSSA